jgi:hypothetical protein
MNKFYKLLTIYLILYFGHACWAEDMEITLAYVGSTEHSAYSGVNQGLEEGNLQGRFLGLNYDLVAFSTLEEVIESQGEIVAILAALSAEELGYLSTKLRQTPVFNLIAKDNLIRSDCLGNVLSIIPSRKMYEDAIMQWGRMHAQADVSASAWHKDFVKFAARDLNKRFHKSKAKYMDEYAWAGWAAFRMVADTVARESIVDSVKMLDYLKTNLSFDGQKGMNMNFRETGQLRQSLLIEEQGELKGEAPVRGISSDMDSLGIRECSK